MKKLLKLSALSLALIGISSGSYAACTGASCTANPVTATVYTPITITKSHDLVFGKFSPGASTGSINDAASTTGGVTPITDATRGAASFSVSGNVSSAYTVTSVPATVTLTGPGPSMIATLTLVGGTSRTLNGSGADTITIQGSLAVAGSATQTAGNYSGTYDVNVNY
jgi:hypothetical protein